MLSTYGNSDSAIRANANVHYVNSIGKLVGFRTNEPWTTQEKLKCVSLYRQGKDIQLIAAYFQRTPTAIKYVLREYGLYHRCLRW